MCFASGTSSRHWGESLTCCCSHLANLRSYMRPHERAAQRDDAGSQIDGWADGNDFLQAGWNAVRILTQQLQHKVRAERKTGDRNRRARADVFQLVQHRTDIAGQTSVVGMSSKTASGSAASVVEPKRSDASRGCLARDPHHVRALVTTREAMEQQQNRIALLPGLRAVVLHDQAVAIIELQLATDRRSAGSPEPAEPTGTSVCKVRIRHRNLAPAGSRSQRLVAETISFWILATSVDIHALIVFRSARILCAAMREGYGRRGVIDSDSIQSRDAVQERADAELVSASAYRPAARVRELLPPRVLAGASGLVAALLLPGDNHKPLRLSRLDVVENFVDLAEQYIVVLFRNRVFFEVDIRQSRVLRAVEADDHLGVAGDAGNNAAKAVVELYDVANLQFGRECCSDAGHERAVDINGNGPRQGSTKVGQRRFADRERGTQLDRECRRSRDR